jgi:hypothetical protein
VVAARPSVAEAAVVPSSPVEPDAEAAVVARPPGAAEAAVLSSPAAPDVEVAGQPDGEARRVEFAALAC